MKIYMLSLPLSIIVSGKLLYQVTSICWQQVWNIKVNSWLDYNVVQGRLEKRGN